MSGFSSTQPISNALNGPSLPLPGARPRRPGIAEPVARTRASSLIAQLALTPNRSAAARHDQPPCIAATSRARKSIEIICAMAIPPATVNQITSRVGNTDSNFASAALMGPLTILLWRYLSRTLERLARLHARFLAGTLPAPRPAETLASPRPRQSSECGAAQGTASEKPRIPAGHVFMPFFVAHLYHAMRQLIEDPEMLALLAASPQAGRILRPLWRRMTADPLPEVLRGCLETVS